VHVAHACLYLTFFLVVRTVCPNVARFEAAAKELKGKVRFVKLDTDKHKMMAARLNIQGLPTLLFLDTYEPKDESHPRLWLNIQGLPTLLFLDTYEPKDESRPRLWQF
jgi:thiol-disulfide isomerase/thioredoxin